MRAAVLVATTLAVSLVSAPLGPKSAFHDMVSMRHSGSAPIVLAARARRVARIDWNGERVLLVAPIKGGGLCASLSGPYGGSSCRQRRVGLDYGLVFPIARLHRLPGHRPLSLSTYARDGRLLSRTNLH
jgi:hypothetical protein